MVRRPSPTFIALLIGAVGAGMTALIIVLLGWFGAFVFGLAGLLVAFLIDRAENDVRGDLPRDAAYHHSQILDYPVDPTEPETQRHAILAVKIVSGAIVLVALVTWYFGG